MSHYSRPSCILEGITAERRWAITLNLFSVIRLLARLQSYPESVIVGPSIQRASQQKGQTLKRTKKTMTETLPAAATAPASSAAALATVAVAAILAAALLALSGCSPKSVAENPDDFLGDWYCDRASIDISLQGEENENLDSLLEGIENGGAADQDANQDANTSASDNTGASDNTSTSANENRTYVVLIHWAGSVSESAEWKYLCHFDADSKCLVDEGKGVHSVLAFSPEGDLLDEAVAYTDGSASFALNKNGELIWQDDKDDAGKGMKFSRPEWSAIIGDV